MRKDLDKIVELFTIPVTIYTNGHLLTRHTFIPGVNYCVSIDGWREFHDGLRGEGSFLKAIQALEMLDNHHDDIESLWIRMTYSQQNWRDISKLYKKAKSLTDVRLLLHPLVGNGLPPLDEQVQMELFKWAAPKDDVVILQPHFWHFCGYTKSTCPAGIHRIAIDEHGNVKPCQWLNEKIGSIHRHSYDELLSRGKEFHENRGCYIEDGCRLCPDKELCRSSCKVCSDSQTCPLRHQITASHFYSGGILKTINVKHQSMSKVGLVGC